MDEAELRLWVENAKLTFPVLFDPDGELSRLFRISNSPMKVLLDHRGKILLYDGFRQGQARMEEYVSLFKNLIPLADD